MRVENKLFSKLQLREKLAEEANCGHIGNYTKCSFEVEGNGRFFAGSKTKPAAGNKEQDNCEKEVRLEMVVGASDLGNACKVIKQYHPYEEPAYEVYKLEDLPLEGYGEGRKVNFFFLSYFKTNQN